MITLPDVLTLDRPLLGIDLETTSNVPAQARIVEIALEIMTPGAPTKEYRTLVNPGVPIPRESTAVHGITDDMVKDAPTFEYLADNLCAGFQGADFAGYNVRFDLTVMLAEMRRHRRTWDYERARILDGYRLWQLAEGRTLSDAVARWLEGSIRVDDAAIAGDLDRESKAHNALWDVKMTTRVIAAQLTACAHLPRDVQALHDLSFPGRFDAEGKLQWKDGELCIAFGQHKGKPLRDMARHERGYLKWMCARDFSDVVKQACEDAIEGRLPQAPQVNE